MVESLPVIVPMDKLKLKESHNLLKLKEFRLACKNLAESISWD